MATWYRVVPSEGNRSADKACPENGDSTEYCVDAMHHIAGHAERFRPENSNIEGEDRGADEGNFTSSESIFLFWERQASSEA